MTEPRRLGKYEILEEVGRGSFAIVYRARDTELGRVVALKVLHPQLTTDPQFVRRFHQEAQAAASLHHPCIITVHEVSEEAGQHYLAMAFLPGCPLDRWLARAEGVLPVERAILIVEQIAGALDAIHGRGLVHRDVKPGNIVVDDAGQATLLDFGIVRAAEGTQLTTMMAVLGTPEYMAPEQAELGEAQEVDRRVDIYALGVVAYEMLVGRPPFTGKSPTAILHKHVYESPPTPTALNPDLPAGLEPILLRALAKEPAERFQQAGTFAAELRRAFTVEHQAREREAQLAPLYERLQDAISGKDWVEVLALGGQIQALDPTYRDVPDVMARARERLRRPQRGPIPTWGWIVGGIVLVALLVALSRLWLPPWPTQGPTATPTSTATPRLPTATLAPTVTSPPFTATPVQALIDINTATAAELETLPGIGSTLAQRIVDYRDANGPFEAVEDIQNVEGIGSVTFEGIRDLITVDLR